MFSTCVVCPPPPPPSLVIASFVRAHSPRAALYRSLWGATRVCVCECVLNVMRTHMYTHFAARVCEGWNAGSQTAHEAHANGAHSLAGVFVCVHTSGSGFSE